MRLKRQKQSRLASRRVPSIQFARTRVIAMHGELQVQEASVVLHGRELVITLRLARRNQEFEEARNTGNQCRTDSWRADAS